jgi:hypothetical protein
VVPRASNVRIARVDRLAIADAEVVRMLRPDVRSAARVLLLVALGVGVVGDILLDGPAPGLNVPLMTLLVLAVAWAVRRSGRAPDPMDAWLPITALVLASGVALRADPFVGLLDLAGAAAFTGASVAAFSGLAVTRRSLSVILMIGAWVLESVMVGAVRLASAARPAPRQQPRTPPSWAAPIGRGLVLTVPLVMILAVLFASADPIFRRGMDDVLGFRLDLGDLPARVLVALAIAWLVGGLLLVAAGGLPALERASLGAAAPTRAVSWQRTLGTTEALVVLIGVDLVVGLFVGLQVAYLFGGLDTLAAAGMTYSDYARRGYFELVAAAGLSGGILVALEYLAVRSRPYLAFATVLVGLTLAVLASAALRLQLYQDAYGWTELRLYVAVSIVAMAATLATLALFLLTDRTRWLGHAMAVIGVVSLVGLNLIAPPAFVAERNLQRVIDPSLVPPDGEATLDADYLAVLPDDAIPTIVAAVPHLPVFEASRLRELLLERREELQRDPALASPFAWNLGRERAKEALQGLR